MRWAGLAQQIPVVSWWLGWLWKIQDDISYMSDSWHNFSWGNGDDLALYLLSQQASYGLFT